MTAEGTGNDLAPGGSAVLDRLKTASDTLDRISDRLDILARRERLTRRLTIGLAASFALDIILTIVVALLTISAVNQSNRVHANQVRIIADQQLTCQIANEARADQIKLWNYVIALSARSPGSKDQAELNQFRNFVRTTFAPEDCAKLYPHPLPG